MAYFHKFFIFFVLVISLQTLPGVSGKFYFRGKVQTKDGTVDIKRCYAITVKKDLIHEQYEGESEEFVDLVYQGLFDDYDQFDYATCNVWCGTYWVNQPYQCVQVIETDSQYRNQGEYLCAGEIVSIPFTFAGMVRTIEGEKYIEKCFVGTVNEDLVEFLVHNENKVTTEEIYKVFFNDANRFDYEECNAYCVRYCSMGEPDDFLTSSINECLQVIEPSYANVSRGEYLCGCNIQFRDSTMENDQQNDR